MRSLHRTLKRNLCAVNAVGSTTARLPEKFRFPTEKIRKFTINLKWVVVVVVVPTARAAPHMLFRFVKLMTYAQRPKRHPMRTEIRNGKHHIATLRTRGRRGEGGGTVEGIYVLAFVFLCRQSAVLVVGLYSKWFEHYSLFVSCIYGDERIDKQAKRAECRNAQHTPLTHLRSQMKCY